ncbi:MAG: dihydroneopterin aldolase [candidate division WOR-3 bacterium]|nr:dihydroneopterin aldolase [candidate division WOR-3 bacterium]
MIKLILRDIETEMYCGLLPQEKNHKNRIVFNIEVSLSENDFVDYSNIYSLILETASGRKWDTLEELAVYSAEHVLEEFPSIARVIVSVGKKNPLQMEKCRSVKALYEAVR